MQIIVKIIGTSSPILTKALMHLGLKFPLAREGTHIVPFHNSCVMWSTVTMAWSIRDV